MCKLEGKFREEQSHSHHFSLSLSPQAFHFMELCAGASPAPLLPAGDAATPGEERPPAAPLSPSTEAVVVASLCTLADYYGCVLLCVQ